MSEKKFEPIIEFLLGSGTIDNLSFGDHTYDTRAPFWWRKQLREYAEKHESIGLTEDELMPDSQEQLLHEALRRLELVVDVMKVPIPASENEKFHELLESYNSIRAEIIFPAPPQDRN